MHQQDFEMDILHEDGAFVVSLRGELDLSRGPDLEAVLLEAEQSDVTRILVDLGELTFIDSTGLGVLVRAAARARSNGDRLRITSPQDQVASIFRLTELDTHLPLHSRTSALQPHTPRDAVRSPNEGPSSRTA